MTAPVRNNQVTLGLQRLITQWRDKPNVVGLLTSYLEIINELEDVYFQLLEERSLDTAVGSQLDVLGLIIGEPRSGRLDPEYREALYLRIAINTSDGTEPVVVSLLKQLSGADTAEYEDVFPAGVRIKLEGPLTFVSQEVLDEIKNILAATIRAELSFVNFISPPFVFENDPDGEGFSDVSVTGVFNLITDTGLNIGLSTGVGDILSVENTDITLDPETFEGGYLADNITITI